MTIDDLFVTQYVTVYMSRFERLQAPGPLIVDSRPSPSDTGMPEKLSIGRPLVTPGD